MGQQDIGFTGGERDQRAFTRAILADIRALELMIERGLIETGVRRVGVEQEMFLVNDQGLAAPVGVEVMENLMRDPRFQSEVALFNLEANLEPRPIGGRFLRDMEAGLASAVQDARTAAQAVAADVLLTGMLPTLRHKDVTPANLTPQPRYLRLDEASMAARNGRIHLAIDGIDRFESDFDSVVIEGANTSIQLHLQVGPAEAAHLYNLAQLISAPCLAAATNSPVLLGKRVWQETRIAVFERAFDDRSVSQLSRGVPTRVGFGSAWVRESIVELFKDNVARYQVIVGGNGAEDSLGTLERGEIPRLRALTMHNGTIWRWNRACYGLTDGRPHLRIENRVLPAGPTVVDEVANAALFYGLMNGLADDYRDIRERISFAEAKGNFLASAYHGLRASYRWLDGGRMRARDLLLQELLPAARAGLAALGVPPEDTERYLDIIEERTDSGRTGATWLLEALADTPEESRMRTCQAAVRVMRDRQLTDTPVHRWEPLDAGLCTELGAELTLGDIMSGDVFTVHPDDVIDLATSVMAWKHIRHVPVEDSQGRLVGLLTGREVLQLLDRAGGDANDTRPVSEFMLQSPPTASPDLGVLEGMERLLAGDAGCLLIVRGDHLAGIVTERDLVQICSRLLHDGAGQG